MLGSVRAHLEFLLQFIDRIAEAGIRFHDVIDRLDGMDHGAVVTASKMVANGFQGMVGEIFAKIHGHLTGDHDFLFSRFILQFLHLDAVVICNRLLDKINPYLGFNVLDEIFDDGFCKLKADFHPV